jgi:hypothetical protein
MSLETGPRDLPRERYLRVAYAMMCRSFGPEVLKVIAERGDQEFLRIVGQIYHSQGFIFTKDELRTIYQKLETRAWDGELTNRAYEDYIDRHGRSERPS